jgi:hypothetical protein
VRNYVVATAIIFCSSLEASAQRLSNDSTNDLATDQFSMIIPPDSSAIALTDSLPPLYQWMDTEENGNMGVWRWLTYSTLVCETMYSVILTEPNSCIDTSLHVTFVDESSMIYTYPWTVSPDAWCGRYWEGCLVPAPDPYKGWHEIDLFSIDSFFHSSLSAFSQMQKGSITSVPPRETPEPPKPAPVPEQPWYQAVLPNPIRVRKG